jgi:hypothetical protein
VVVSGKPALIRQRDLTRIVKGFAAAGITVGIVVRDGEATVLPVDLIKKPAEPSAIERFRARRNAGKVGGHP